MTTNPVKTPLQKQVSSTLVAVIAIFALLTFVTLRAVVAPAFDELEKRAAETDLVRAQQAIRTDIDNLEALTADWAPWDDIYEYVRGNDPAFRRSNLDRPTLVNLDLDMMAVYALDGQLMWSQLLVDEEELPVEELGILSPGHEYYELLARHAFPESRSVGIVESGHGPMIVSSRPILRSDDSGPIAGTVVMAQFLDDDRLARLQERTEVDIRWHLAADVSIGDLTGSEELGREDIVLLESGSEIASFTILSDIRDIPVMVLETKTPREISTLGAQTIGATMLFLGVIGVLITVVIWFLLKGRILQPIEMLAAHMHKIQKSGDLSQELTLDRDDEISALARQFDELTAEVHDARQALLDQSYKAGKADTAAEVLHNIRNALTPMINGLDRLRKSFRVSTDLRVTEASNQLRDPECDYDRKDKLLQYIDASFRHVQNTGEDATQDLRMVSSQARQVEAILADQERFANVAPVAENITVENVVGEAAHVIPKDRHLDVNLDLSEDLSRYSVRAHRIGLLQVLGNLILNAYESIQRSEKGGGRICLSAIEEVVEDRTMIRVTVQDDGTGFDDNVQKRIFQRGYSSKRKGNSSGLGLHWCANAVAGMGGRIFAESTGLGQGARFHVLLPAAQGGPA